MLLALVAVETVHQPESVLSVVNCVYWIGQAGGVLLMLAAGFEVLRKVRQGSPTYAGVRLSFLYLPLAGLSALGALLWFVALSAGAAFSAPDDDWTSGYLKDLPYDLATVEIVVGFTVFVVGVAWAWVAGNGVRIARPEDPDRDIEGQRTRDRGAVLLLATPLVMLLGLGCAVLFGVAKVATIHGLDVLGIYSVSALRALPLLGLFAVTLRAAFDSAGDVILYLVPEESPLAIAGVTRERLKRALAGVLTLAPEAELVVVGHSQGSVIALDTLRSLDEPPPMSLITIGSPLASLYERFLLSSPQERVSGDYAPVKWVNYFRGDDFVGGEIPWSGVENVLMGPGGHSAYWNDRDEVLERALLWA